MLLSLLLLTFIIIVDALTIATKVTIVVAFTVALLSADTTVPCFYCYSFADTIVLRRIYFYCYNFLLPIPFHKA